MATPDASQGVALQIQEQGHRVISLLKTRASHVGVIGLGAMGSAIANHLLGRKFTVGAFRRSSMEEFIREGGAGCSSADAVARSSPLLLLTLPDGGALASLFGDEEFLSALTPDHVIVSLGTYPLQLKEYARATAANYGATMLDCEVSGTPHMIAARQASVFASGDELTFAAIEHVFDAWADKVIFLGEFGTATKMKLLAQQLVAIHTAAAAETIALGKRYGLDAEAIVRVLSTSAAGSSMLTVRGPSMANESFSPQGGTVASFSKSLELVRQLAANVHAATPLLDIADACYKKATDLGLGEADISAVLCVFAHLSENHQK
jgi:3-hydroxyisobutyrate dehydrogenase-like beta-hydroxyacid dehydrogenase